MIAALAPAKELNVPDVKRQLDMLREGVQGGLGLGSGGKASRGQQVGVTAAALLLLRLHRSFEATWLELC